jgi:hypothetical protein
MTSNLPQREAVARIKEQIASLIREDASIDIHFDITNADHMADDIMALVSSLQDRWRPPEGWRDHVTDTVHRVAKRTSEEGYSVAIMREGIEAIISSLKGSDVGEVGECSMCFGKLKPEEDGGRDCESCGAVWVEGT